jgi:hypothetical protein
MKLTGENRSTQGKTCPSATLSTTNPTWTDLGWNPVRVQVERARVKKLKTIRHYKNAFRNEI